MRELVLGGARSGKSHYAEQRAQASDLPVCVVVTAQAGDAEMAARIAHHQTQRPPHWRVVEAPLNLAATLHAEARDGQCLIVDCLTLWLTNLLCQTPHQLDAERTALLACLPVLPGNTLLVSNETGMGVVPLGELTRRFVDEAGRLNQAVAQVCERVILVAAGLPLVLKAD